jgi:hypothetical protein
MTLIGESLGRHFWQRPLSANEMIVLALSIPLVWLWVFVVRWWHRFLDQR